MSLSNPLQALADNPGTIVAWLVDHVGDSVLAHFRIEGGTKELGSLVVPKAGKADMTAALAEAGHVPGFYGRSTGIVWRRNGETFTVWNGKGQQLHSDGKTVEVEGRTLAIGGTIEVVAFLDDELVDRGVSLRAAGDEHLVVKDQEMSAFTDMSYGPLDALDDCGWTVYLARALAEFLGGTFIDETR